MAANIEGVLEKSLQSKIQTSKLLVVGAGGIGCEILKNLVLCGFSDIEIVSCNSNGMEWVILTLLLYFRLTWTQST